MPIVVVFMKEIVVVLLTKGMSVEANDFLKTFHWSPWDNNEVNLRTPLLKESRRAIETIVCTSKSKKFWLLIMYIKVLQCNVTESKIGNFQDIKENF